MAEEGRDWKDTYKLEALLTGDTSRLKKAVDRARALLKRLESEDGEMEIDADSKPLERKITVAKKQLARLKNSSAEIEIKADNKDFMGDVAQSTAAIEALKRKASVIEMNAQGLERLKQLQSVKVSSVDVGGKKVNVAPDFDTKVAESKVSRFKAMLKSIPNRIKTWLEVDVDFDRRGIISRLGAVTDEFQTNMNKMARSIQSFGVVLGNQFKGGLLASLTALVPIVATLVPAIMALGNAIGVVGGGLIGLAGAFGMAGIAGVGFGGMLATVLARYNSDTFEATKASALFTDSIEGIKSAWNGIVDQNQANIFNTMTTAIRGATSALQALQPMFKGVTAVAEEASVSFRRFIENSPIAERFFNMMNTTGVAVFETMLSAVGKFGAGFMQVFNLLEPLIVNMANGFENLGERFLNWSQKVGTEKNFQKFADYVQQTLPVIGSIFGSTFQGIINLFASFGDNSAMIFDRLAEMAERFKQWSATVAESDGFQKFIDYVQTHGPTVMSLIGNIIMTIVNLGIALAPLGAAVLNVVNAFFGFTSELLKNHPIVGVLIGVITTLFGVFMMLLPVIIQGVAIFHQLIKPMITAYKNGTLLSTAMTLLKSAFAFLTGTVMTIIGVITLLVASFMLLWNTNEGFRTRVLEIWNQIKEHISNAITAISNFIHEIWGALVAWWNENNVMIMSIVEDAWMNGILPIIETVMNILVPIIKVAWAVIKTVITVALDVILMVVKVAMQLFTEDWSGAWQTVLEFLKGAWEGIKNAINSAISFLLPYIIEFAVKAYSWIKEKFEQAKTILETIWSVIKARIQARLIQILTNLVLKFQQMKQAIQDKMDQAKAILQSVWDSIRARIRDKIAQIVINVRQKFQEIKQNIQDKLQQAKQAVVDKFNQMRTSAVNKAQEILANIRQKFEQIKQNIRDKITQAKTHLVNKMSEMATNARTKAVEVYNNIRTKISEIPEMVGGFISDAVQAVRDKFSQFKEAGGNIVQSIADGITNAVGKVTSAIGSVTQKIRDYLPFSPAKRGALRSIMKTNVAGSIAETIKRQRNLPVREMARMTQGIQGVIDGYNPTVKPQLAGITQGIRQAQMSAKATMQHNIQTQMEAPNQNLELELNLGNRAYKGFVGGITGQQRSEVRLEEKYDL